MTREDAQPAWEKIVETGFSDYNKLTREQRVWFNVEPLITGGLWDHYVNHGADKNADTIADLEYLKFKSVADQLRAFNKKYFSMVYRQDRMPVKRHLKNFLKSSWRKILRRWMISFGR